MADRIDPSLARALQISYDEEQERLRRQARREDGDLQEALRISLMDAQRPASAAAVAEAASRPASAAPANAAQAAAIARMDESNREILQGILARTAQSNARRVAQDASMRASFAPAPALANASNPNCSTCRMLTSTMGYPMQCAQCRRMEASSSLPSAAAPATAAPATNAMDEDAEAHKYFDGFKIDGKSAIFEYFKLKDTMGSVNSFNAILSKLQQTMTPKDYFQFMKSRDSIASGGVAAAQGGVAAAQGGVAAAQGGVAASGPCEFPIWAALTQSQRACFMDGAGNIVANPTEINGIRNRAVETLLAAFFKGAVPTKDPCPHSIPEDTPENREAAWDVLCRLLPGDQKGALRDEALDFAVFHDPVILSDGNTYGRAPLMEWFANSPTDPNGTPVTPAERASPTPNTRLKQFIDTFNLGGSQERQDMLGGRKLSRRRKSKSSRRRMRRKTKTMRRRKTSKAKSKR